MSLDDKQNEYLQETPEEVINRLSNLSPLEYPPMSTYLSPVKFKRRRQKWQDLAKNLKYNP